MTSVGLTLQQISKSFFSFSSNLESTLFLPTTPLHGMEENYQNEKIIQRDESTEAPSTKHIVNMNTYTKKQGELHQSLCVFVSYFRKILMPQWDDIFENDKFEQLDVSHVFMHTLGSSTDPQYSSSYGIVGGSPDRSLSFLRQPEKWRQRGENLQFNDLPLRIQEFITKFGVHLGGPPRAQDARLSSIDLGASSPVPAHSANTDFGFHYILPYNSSIIEILDELPSTIECAAEQHNESEEGVSTAERALFINYRFHISSDGPIIDNDVVSEINQFFKSQFILINFDDNIDDLEFITKEDYVQEQFTNYVFQPLTLFSQFEDQVYLSLLKFIAEDSNNVLTINLHEDVECDDINSYASEFLVSELNANLQHSLLVLIDKIEDTETPEVATLDAAILNDLPNFHENELNSESDTQSSSESDIDDSMNMELNESDLSGLTNEDETSGVLRLLAFRGFNLLGSRIRLPFIFPVGGFLRTTLVKFQHHDRASGSHAIYYTANRIKRPNAPAKFVLDRYASLPTITNIPLETSHTERTHFNFDNLFNATSKPLMPITSDIGFHESTTPLLADSFGSQLQFPYGSRTEHNFLLELGRESVNRVKFKNNLSRIGHRLRVEFATILNMKFHYNKQLTKFLPVFYKRRGITVFKSIEMQLCNVLVRARIVLTPRTSDELVSSFFVYVNRILVCNSHMQMAKYDFIQLPVSAKYFSYFRGLHAGMLKKNSRLMPRVILIADAKRRNRSQPIKYPRGIVKNRYFDEDVPNYMEVDFLSMSIALLDIPKHFLEFDSFLMRYLNGYAPKMLNGKFIT